MQPRESLHKREAMGGFRHRREGGMRTDPRKMGRHYLQVMLPEGKTASAHEEGARFSPKSLLPTPSFRPWDPDFGLLASRTTWEWSCVVLSHHVCGHVLRQPTGNLQTLWLKSIRTLLLLTSAWEGATTESIPRLDHPESARGCYH